MIASNAKLTALALTGLQLLIVASSYAKENSGHIHGAHEECSLPKSTLDIVSCALKFHPNIKRGTFNFESSKKLEEKAAQIPNPVLTSRYVKGNDSSEDLSEFEANLKFTLELGGKKVFRKDHAMATKKNVMASNDRDKAEIKIKTISNLYRLRQVLAEKEVIKEALKAFSKVTKQLRKLPRLSAEQEASLILLEITFEETKINASELFEEERELEHYFHIATGHSIEEIREFLPNAPKKWPSVVSKSGSNPSPEINRLKSLSYLAQKKLEIQKSNAWPDLKIGPSFSIEKKGNVENKMIGLSLQIPIPFFQVNGGGKSFARSELRKARKNVALTQAEEDHERIEQSRIYESAVNTLKKTMKQKAVEKKHRKIENLYLRGVISSSVFLDSLKQKLSYLKSRNHRELTAIRALWNIYKYDGKIFEEKL